MIQDVLKDFSTNGHLPAAVVVVRLLGAALMAVPLGLEREIKHRPAGLRTHMLVALAAAMFAVLATEIAASPRFSGQQVRADPLRVVQAVTSGVAFLAAGFIIFSRGHVRGVTTGAGIWLAAAVGLAAGYGYWLIALVGMIVGAFVMAALRRVEGAFDLKKRPHYDDDPRAD